MVVFGTSGNDSLTATKFNGRVTLNGGNGDDSLLAAMQLTSLIGGNGNDHLVGGAGGTFHNAGPGTDHMQGGAGTDCYVTFPKLNLVLTSNKSVGEGTDVLDFIDAAMVTGSKGRNQLDASGFAGPVTLDGGAGDDVLLGGPGNNILNGNTGFDRYTAIVPGGAFVQTATQDRLIGTMGTDDFLGIEEALFDATAASDGVSIDHFFFRIRTTIHGSAHDDILFASQSGSVLKGNGGNDQLNGNVGHDQLFGGDGNDILIGGAGNDGLFGEAGTDSFDGGAGSKDVSDRKPGESQTGVP